MIFIVELVDKSQKNQSQRLWKYGIFGLIRYFGSTKILGISSLHSLKRFLDPVQINENSTVQTYFTIIFTKMHQAPTRD